MYEQYLADPTSVSETGRSSSPTTAPTPRRGRRRPRAAPPRRRPSRRPTPASRRRSPTPAAGGRSRAAAAAAAAAGRGRRSSPSRSGARRPASSPTWRQPRGPHRHQLPRGAGQAARGQPQVINSYLGRTRGGKVSFTHLIGYAVVRAIADHLPVMNRTFVADADGKPQVVRHDHVNLGIAVDVEKADGSRTLLVPVIKDADTLDFRGFLGAYEDLIRKVRSNKLQPRRLRRRHRLAHQPRHHRHRAVGAPPHAGPGRHRRRRLASTTRPPTRAPTPPRSPTSASPRSSPSPPPTTTASSRAPSPACSSRRCTSCCSAATTSTTRVFRSLGVPYEAVQWRRDVNPVDREEALLDKQIAGRHAHPRAPGPRPPHRRPRPAGVEGTGDAAGARPGHLRAHDLGPRPRVPHRRRSPAQHRMPLGEILGTLRDAYCRTIGIEYMHIQEPEEKRWIQQQVEGAPPRPRASTTSATSSTALNAAEAFEKFLATKYVGQKRFGIEGAESAIPILDAVLEAGRRRRPRRRRAWAWPTAAGSTCSPTSSARATTSCSRSSRATSTPTRPRARAT